MSNIVLIHYGELALKGKNRGEFENKLMENIRKIVGADLIKKIRRFSGRMVLELREDKFLAESPTSEIHTSLVEERLLNVFGISWFAMAEKIDFELKESGFSSGRFGFLQYIQNICNKVIETAKPLAKKKTFKIETVRADKTFPKTSMEMNSLLGEAVGRAYDVKVSLKNPDFTIFVEITREGTYLYTKKVRGPEGLPVGTAGKVLALLSGGIDSPVASWLMMRRGLRVDYLHFHTFLKGFSVRHTKIASLYEILSRYDPDAKLYLASYNEFHSVLRSVPKPYHLILFRRFMVKLAQRLSQKIGARAIVTGDNLSQVASQTMESLAALDCGISVPVYRPLLGFTKEEITERAKNIKTYEASLKPYRDCCSLVSFSPATKPKIELVEKYENEIGMEETVDSILSGIEVF